MERTCCAAAVVAHVRPPNLVHSETRAACRASRQRTRGMSTTAGASSQAPVPASTRRRGTRPRLLGTIYVQEQVRNAGTRCEMTYHILVVKWGRPTESWKLLVAPRTAPPAACLRCWPGGMNLFGRSKPNAAAPTPSGNSSGGSSTSDAIGKLRDASETMEKREEHLMRKIDNEIKQAKDFSRLGKKREALTCIKRKKMYEKQ